MRILHLLNHTLRLNGHVHAAVDLACAQTAMGHTVCVGSGHGEFDELLARRQVTSVRIDHRRRPLDLVKSLLALRRHVRTWQPDVIHAHMVTSAVLAWPVCKLAGIPLVTTVHNEFERSATLMGLGSRVIGVSAAVARSMQRRGVPARKLSVVLNGTIGSARFEGRGTVPMTLPSPSVLFVGGQHPRKGLPTLIEAFDRVHARCPQARLYVVGDGPLLGTYKEMAMAAACADAVTFAGPVRDPYPWMLGADIFVLPSHADPAPLVLSEAREAGCAIVASAVDGIPELLEGGSAGILVPPGDPDNLAAALCSLIESPSRLKDWRANSQLNIAHLAIDRVAKETLKVYEAARAPARLHGASARAERLG
ncbi:glycosyltransferase family 4 protein [Phreatobacter sp.]|uniref:glycosyltransferase family 4 protein n=1 Tax=Phreatobacter sp. TaxID=1966341 RepID=UPI003F6F9A18